MITKLITFLLFIYQKVFSPLKPVCCRFYPSCSEYMVQSIQKKGVIKGWIKGFLRVLRCHPFHPGGYDPV